MVEGLGEEDDFGLGFGLAYGFCYPDALIFHIVELVAPEDVEKFVGEDGGGDLHFFRVALELVDLALEAGVAGAGKGKFGEANEAALFIADEVEGEEGIDKVAGAFLVVGLAWPPRRGARGCRRRQLRERRRWRR